MVGIRRYWVKFSDGTRWGPYDSLEEAKKAAERLGGDVIPKPESTSVRYGARISDEYMLQLGDTKTIDNLV